MSLWGFATAHFHGKSSVLYLCHHCQVLIIHRDDSQSKAETHTCPCHRTPPGWEKPCLYIRGRKGMDSHWLASIASWLWICFEEQALSKCIKQWSSGSHVRLKNCPTDCEKWIGAVCSSLITFFSFPLSFPEQSLRWTEHCWIMQSKENRIKSRRTSLGVPSYCPEVTRIHIQLTPNQWSLEFMVQKEAELFTVIKQGGKPVPEASSTHSPPKKTPHTFTYTNIHAYSLAQNRLKQHLIWGDGNGRRRACNPGRATPARLKWVPVAAEYWLGATVKWICLQSHSQMNTAS